MLSLIVSILMLGFIVAFHEFGHFIVARAFGVGVVEYAIGMGPRLLSTVKGKTRYSLRMVPFGGACYMLGEDDGEEEEDSEIIVADGREYSKDELFLNKKAWQRFFVVVAGPVFNFILVFIFALIITLTYGYDKPVITGVLEGSPAAQAGIEAGDRITGIKLSENEKFEKIDTSRDLYLYMTVNAGAIGSGSEFSIRFLDGSEDTQKIVNLSPAYSEENDAWLFGFSYNSAYSSAEGIGEVLYYSLYDIKYCLNTTVQSIKMIAQGMVTRNDVMGPVRMVAVMDETVESASNLGFIAAAMTLLNIGMIISGSLGAMNLLPIPALDGGRLIFIILEMIARRPVPRNIEGMVNMAGMLLLLLLMAVIMFNDISLLAMT